MEITAKDDQGVGLVDKPTRIMCSSPEILAFDDLTGDELEPALMKMARTEEIKYFKEMRVYEKVSIDEAFKITGKAPIAVS